MTEGECRPCHLRGPSAGRVTKRLAGCKARDRWKKRGRPPGGARRSKARRKGSALPLLRLPRRRQREAELAIVPLPRAIAGRGQDAQGHESVTVLVAQDDLRAGKP